MFVLLRKHMCRAPSENENNSMPDLGHRLRVDDYAHEAMCLVKLLSTPAPRHSFRWTPKCMSHSARARECNIIAACECDVLGLNFIAWNHCRSDPVQVQSTV